MIKKQIVLGLVVSILAIILMAGINTRVAGTPSLTRRTPLSLDVRKRVLILDPHGDDKTLGPTGFIQLALRKSWAKC